MQIDNENQPGGEILLYQTEDGQTRLETRMTGDTVWLSLGQMFALFQRDKSVISRHIRNIFEEGELPPVATVAIFATVQSEGKRQVERDVAHYNLDVEYAPFSQQGGLGKVHQLFGPDLTPIMENLNTALIA